MKIPVAGPSNSLRELGATFIVAGGVAFVLGADWSVGVAALGIGTLFVLIWAVGLRRGRRS